LLKGSGLKSFVPDDEPITVPPEQFDAIATPIEKEEEVTRERILPQEFPNHALETIESFSHIRWPGAKENAHRGRELRKHQWSPRPELSSCPAALIAAWSKPTSTEPLSRTVQPLASSISSSVVVLRSMIDTGTNAAALPTDKLLADSSDPDGVIWDPELTASCSRRRFLQ
jgi:hypothetical protein